MCIILFDILHGLVEKFEIKLSFKYIDRNMFIIILLAHKANSIVFGRKGLH